MAEETKIREIKKDIKVREIKKDEIQKEASALENEVSSIEFSSQSQKSEFVPSIKESSIEEISSNTVVRDIPSERQTNPDNQLFSESIRYDTRQNTVRESYTSSERSSQERADPTLVQNRPSVNPHQGGVFRSTELDNLRGGKEEYSSPRDLITENKVRNKLPWEI